MARWLSFNLASEEIDFGCIYASDKVSEDLDAQAVFARDF